MKMTNVKDVTGSNKLTIDEFWNEEKFYAINVKTEKEAIAICKALHASGHKWRSNFSYLEINHWDSYKGETCYCNNGGFANVPWCLYEGYDIYGFNDIDFQNYLENDEESERE